MTPTQFSFPDMGDYAEKVLACLEAQKRYFNFQSTENLVAAKKAEMELSRLSKAILEQLGRRVPRRNSQPTLWEYLEASTPPAPSRGLPD